MRPDSGIVMVTYERSAQPDQNWQVETPSKVGWRAVVDICCITGGGANPRLQLLMHDNTVSCAQIEDVVGPDTGVVMYERYAWL